MSSEVRIELTRRRRMATRSDWTASDAQTQGPSVAMRIQLEKEDDGRWLGEVPELPGVMAYGPSREEALNRGQTIVLACPQPRSYVPPVRPTANTIGSDRNT